jgi:hypothetical protein
MSEQPIHVVSTQSPSPIRWTSVTFLRTSHRNLTSDPVFTDNVLALLLRSPRDSNWFGMPQYDSSTH